jgi:hypothetical protein
MSRFQLALNVADLEEATTCCSAVQDEVWVTGPDGERFETDVVLADAPATGEDSSQRERCCVTTGPDDPRTLLQITVDQVGPCC